MRNPAEEVLQSFMLRYGPFESFRLLKDVAHETNNWQISKRYRLSVWNVRLLVANPHVCLLFFARIVENHYAEMRSARDALRRA